MWISAALQWFVVSPGMHAQNEFPTKLFLARLAVLSPLCGWMGAYLSSWDMIVLFAGPVAMVADFVFIIIQVLLQSAMASRGRY